MKIMSIFSVSNFAAKGSAWLRGSLLLGLAALITACGGGGGGSSSDGPTTIPIATAYNDLIVQGLETQTNITGTVSELVLGGEATVTFSGTVAATFEGVTGMSSGMSIDGLLSVGQSPPVIPVSHVQVTYYDSDYEEIGGTSEGGPAGSSYAVVTAATALPKNAKAGDTGTIYTATTYSGPAKMAVIGSKTLRYRVEADSSNSLILTLSSQFLDINNQQVENDDFRFRVDKKGTLSLLSVVVTGGNANVTFTAK
jgi:hypothetical protein